MLTEQAGVPRKPFAEAFQRSGMSAQDLARGMGYMRMQRGREIPDPTRALRALGLRDERNGGYVRRRGEYISYDLAVRFCRALDLDPVDYGI